MPYQLVVPHLDSSVRELCRKRYRGHPRGCPNYGKKAGCPPGAKLWADSFDIAAPAWVIWNRYSLLEHVRRMRAGHPKWSDRQCECCLYWQGTARKALKAEIDRYRWSGRFGRHYEIVRCPEAMGVNVTATMRSVGIELEWPPQRWSYQVALSGRRSP